MASRVWCVMPAVGIKERLKRNWKQVRASRPGHRFQDQFERAHAAGRGSTPARVLRISIALLALTIAGVLSVIPGPAIPFFFVAGALLASESRLIARFMDWIEVKVRAVFDWVHRHWRRLSLVPRVALVILAAGLSMSSAVLLYRLVRG